MERARSWRWDLLMIALVALVFFALTPLLLIRARERSRQDNCANHLKVLVLGLQNYHDALLYLPYGARTRKHKDVVSAGPSWIVSSSDFWEGKSQLFADAYAVSATDPQHDFASSAILKTLDGKSIKLLNCPASPLPSMETVQGALLTVPSYVGIMGADPRLPDSDALHPSMGVDGFSEGRIGRGISNGDQLSSGGMLPVNDSLPFAACVDGTANTIIIGETSTWYRQVGKNYRIDGAHGGSWLGGTDVASRPEFNQGSFPGKAYNLTAIRYPGGIDGEAPGAPSINSGNTGIAEDHGANNPLASAHANGVMVAFLDGHVLLIRKETSTLIWKRMATRDDSGVVCGDDF